MNHFPKNRHQKKRYDNPRLELHVHVEFLETRQLLSVTDVGHSSENVMDHQAENMSDQIAVTRLVSHSSISQLSSPTRSIPAGGTSLLPDAQPADNFILGGSASNTAALSVQVNDNQTLPFDNYVRLETPTVPTNVWDINLSLTPLGDLVQDDVVFISFYARGEPSGGATAVQANAYLQENGTNSKLVTIPVNGHTQWQHFSTKLEVGSSIDDGGYKFVIHAGFAEQALEIGGLEIQNYGRLGHRLSDYTVTVQDKFGNPLPEATLDVQMTNHGFKFGTQVRDQLYAITEEEFNALNDSQRMALTPNLEDSFNISRFVPTWTDVLNHRNAVLNTFNHVVPTTGFQWVAIENSGTSVPEAAVNRATADGQSVTAASVVWQKDRWPTPEAYRSASSPNAQTFHDALVDARLGPESVLKKFSLTGTGPEINDWKLLNEPLHENYYQQIFVDAGLYTNEVEALADYFKRADVVRPDVTLSINEYAVINSQNDDFAIQYRNLIQSLLDAGAPIDRIGVQAHISRNDITKEDIIRRLDLLAETGLPIEISEFDMRDDAEIPQLNTTEQERMFRDMLEVTFEHPAVDGFIMWGVWDKVHWRGNAPLFDSDWNIKPEAAPWFDLVHGQWKPDLVDEAVSDTGEWIAPIGLYNGDYQITAEANGVSSVVNVTVSHDGNYVITVDTTASSAIPVVDQVVISEAAAMVVGETVSISVQGSNFDPAATVTLAGLGTTLNSFSHTSASTLELSVTLSASASQSSQTLVVTNPNNVTGQKVFVIGQLSPSDSLAHRKSDVTIRVVDQLGNPIPDATVDVGMTEHAFRFGTQIRGPLLAVTHAEFDGYTDQKKQGLLPNLTSLGQARYTPTWQDVLNYRSAVISNFNHIVPGNDLQWQAFNGNGSANPDAAYALAFANGLTAGAVHVVWEKPDWPTPAAYRDGATFNPQDFHDDLITDRLSSTGIMNFYSDSGPGVTITDWNVLNEPLHVTHYSDTFETAGIYTSNVEAWTDYFIRADVIRPDARLLINDYNILNSASDTATIQYRDLINSLLAAGAPIDRIGLQAHIALNNITKADIVRRLDLLAETGLTIEITEFDSRDDAGQLTPVQQEQIFQDMLEAAFEHESVDGFIMWGFWDNGHWRGNAPLFDAAWNVKSEAAPWFDLVHGEWKPNLVGQSVDAVGEWVAPEGLFDGTYDITAQVNGRSATVVDVAVNGSGVQVVTIDLQTELPTLDALSEVNIIEDALEQTISLTGITAGGGETQPLSITAVSDKTGLIPDPTVDFDGQSSVGSLRFTPVADQSGTATITVTVEDGGLDNDLGTPEDNGVINRTVTVITEAVNDEPTLDTLSEVNILEDAAEQTVSLTGITAGGGENQLLSITAVSDNTGLIPDPTVDFDGQSSVGSLRFTPVADQSGTATITVTVEDGGLDNDLGTPEDNGVINRTVTVITEAVNDEPTLDTLSEVNILEDAAEQTVSLTGITAGGGENQLLSITAVSDNTGLIPDPTVDFDGQSSTGTLKFTPVADQSGTATITVTVEDGGLDNDLGTSEDNRVISRTVTVMADPVNDAPTLDALSEVNIIEDALEQTISLTGITAGGGETQPLSITAVSDKTGLIPDPTVDFDGQSSTGTLKFTPVADQSGTATITVTVEDGGLDNDLGTSEDNRVISRTVTVMADPVNDAPTLDALSEVNIIEDALEQTISLTGITAGGGETQPLSITAVSDKTGLIPDPTVTIRSALGVETRLLTVTPLPDQYGIATITVTVEDGGLDLDPDTAEDNATFSQTFDITVTPDTDNPPLLITPHGRMFIHETLSGDSLVSYQLPAVNVNGEAINGLFNRITATSSDTALIPDPTVLYASADVPSSLSFTPVANANGTTTLSIQVEDGGSDNNFATTEDNRQATHQVEVNVLEVISNQGSAILAKDGTENLYVNTQPVVYHEQQAQSTIAGFAAIGATSQGGENALLVERSSVRNRLVTDDTWRINGLFDSLQNESSPVLDLSAREVSSTLNVAAISGAYEINGVNNPTLIVRRGQAYTFNLNAAGHPLYLQATGNGYESENTYSGGFTGNGQASGEHEWVVPQDAPDEIFYQCEFHPVMFGKIIVVD